MAVKQATTKFRHVKVIVLSGETGVGKTRAAIEYGGYMIHADDMSWWDGYQGEETLIIDEYASKTPITQLLGLLDGYQKRLPIKGGFTYANWIKVIITTNQTCLHEKSADAHRRALDRRITQWVEVQECTEVMGNITHHFDTTVETKVLHETSSETVTAKRVN